VLGQKPSAASPPSSPSSASTAPPPYPPPMVLTSPPPNAASNASPARTGLFASVMSALSSFGGKEVKQSPQELAWQQLVANFGDYSGRIGTLLKAVEKGQDALGTLVRSIHDITAALEDLSLPNSGEEQSGDVQGIGKAGPNGHAMLTIDTFMPVMVLLQQLFTNEIISPLRTLLASHAELATRVEERERLNKQYQKAAKQFSAMQKKAAKVSRKKRKPSSNLETNETPSLGLLGRLGMRSYAPPAPPTVPSSQSASEGIHRTGSGRPAGPEEMGGEEEEEEGGLESDSEASGGEGSVGDGRRGDDSLDSSFTSPGHAIRSGSSGPLPSPLLSPPLQDEKRARAAADLSSLYTRSTALTDVLTDKLAHAIQRRETVHEHSSKALLKAHCTMAQGLYAAFQPVITVAGPSCQLPVTSPDAFCAHLAADMEREASLSSSFLWFDEGASARAATRARDDAKKQEHRRYMEHEAIHRAVPLQPTPWRVPMVIRHASIGRVTGSSEWMAVLAGYGTLPDLVALSGTCKAWHSMLYTQPDIWLASIQRGGVGGGGTVGQTDTEATQVAYRAAVLQQQTEFQVCAHRRLAFWERALGLDGRAAPRWSVIHHDINGYPNESGPAPTPFRPATSDEVAALVRLAIAESAGGAKQDGGEDGDQVYSNGNIEEEVACRWAGMIEQDVLRSYAPGAPFGSNSAVLRGLQRMEERCEDERGDPKPLPMQAFVGPTEGLSSSPESSHSGSMPIDSWEASSEEHAASVEARRGVLRTVLMATAASEPHLRYTQGMSSAARLLVELCIAANGGRIDASIAPRAFNLLGTFLRLGTPSTHEPGTNEGFDTAASGLGCLFDHDSANLKMRLYQAERLLVRHLPETASLLLREDLQPAAFASAWLLTLFANFSALPLCEVASAWDCFLVGGWSQMFERFLLIMSNMHPVLVGQPMEELLKRLQAPLAYTYGRGSTYTTTACEEEEENTSNITGDSTSIDIARALSSSLESHRSNSIAPWQGRRSSHASILPGRVEDHIASLQLLATEYATMPQLAGAKP
jgi:hypothetical protein